MAGDKPGDDRKSALISDHKKVWLAPCRRPFLVWESPAKKKESVDSFSPCFILTDNGSPENFLQYYCQPQYPLDQNTHKANA